MFKAREYLSLEQVKSLFFEVEYLKLMVGLRCWTRRHCCHISWSRRGERGQSVDVTPPLNYRKVVLSDYPAPVVLDNRKSSLPRCCSVTITAHAEITKSNGMPAALFLMVSEIDIRSLATNGAT